MMEESVIFRKKVKRNIRRNFRQDENEDDESMDVMYNLKELQHLRKKPRGISNEMQESSDTIKKNSSQFQEDDMYKLKVGGLVNLSTINKDRKKSKFSNEKEDDIELDIGTGFSKETNRRDEDAEMMKYIEEELEKKKGKKEDLEEFDNRFLNPNDALYYVSEHLKKSCNKKSEEMMSNQMLCGIPEVNLGIESKIANIEATELEKQRIETEMANRKKQTQSFVPTNVTVNFAQHERFTIETDKSYYMLNKTHGNHGGLKSKAPKEVPQPETTPQEPTVNIEKDEKYGDDLDITNKYPVNETLKVANKSAAQHTHVYKKRINPEKATDDFYFERYRKQFQRY